jgi:hypothetical protein
MDKLQLSSCFGLGHSADRKRSNERAQAKDLRLPSHLGRRQAYRNDPLQIQNSFLELSTIPQAAS